MFSIATLDGVGRLADEISAADGGGAILFLILFVVVRGYRGRGGCRVVQTRERERDGGMDWRRKKENERDGGTEGGRRKGIRKG